MKSPAKHLGDGVAGEAGGRGADDRYSMGRPQGFRCRRCRTELLARPASSDRALDAEDWVLPLSCCGFTLQRLPLDQVLAMPLPRGRQAQCSLCGFSVQIVVRPAGPLVCATCGRKLDVQVAGDVPAADESGLAFPQGGST